MTDFRKPHHLPNLRPDRRPPDPRTHLPRQRRGVTPQMIGRYPDYDVFDAVDTWDGTTRAVVERRLRPHRGPLRFFSPDEEPAVRAFCDTVTDQDGEPRIPVVEMVDDKLAEGRLDGYQFAGLPDDRRTWQLVLRGLDETAQARYGAAGFAALDGEARRALCGQLATGELSGGCWDALDVRRAWMVCMRDVLAQFYSHPWAWNEIGFGGPAYPRGFMRFGSLVTTEPFETPGAVATDPVAEFADQP